MLVTELKVSGYKTLRDVTWHPGRLNVVIGPNASGKSNLLRLLRTVNRSATGQLYDAIIGEGGMGAILWNEVGINAGIGFEIVSRKEARHDEEHIRYSLTLARVGGSSSFTIRGEQLELVHNGRENYMPIDRSDQSATFFLLSDDFDTTTISRRDNVKPTESLLSTFRDSGDPRVFPPIRNCAAEYFEWTIHDEFHSEKSAEIRRPVVARHDEQLDPDGQNLASVLHTYYENDADFQESIDQAMTAAFGDEYRSLAFPPAGSQNIELCVRWRSIKRPQPASTLSDGTLRFLFLITALSLPKPPSLIAIDEPETGLHPMMMRIVAEYAENAALKSQVIFTTHSTAFLNGFSKDEPPTVTVMDLVDGESRMRVVDPETLGRWLKDYSLGQLYQSHELEQMPGLEEAA